MAQKITPKTTDLFVGTILKVIKVKENTPFQLNKFYPITDGDGVGTLFVGGYSDIELTMHELGDYFEQIASLDDIEDLESKALTLKENFEQFKNLTSQFENDNSSSEDLIETAIIYLVRESKGDEIELQFICNNMDITMVEQCSCCGKVLMPDDEAYEDDLNDGAPLCDHCSVFDEDRDMYIKSVHQDVIEKITGLKFAPHIGNVGSIVEEFNHWLNRYKLAFSYSHESSKQNFIDFINGCTEFNICDLMEKTNNLKCFTSEDEVLRDSILVFIFSDIAPTYSELINAGEIKSNWQLIEEYENYDYSLVLEKVNERLVEFKAHLNALEKVKSKHQTNRMYGIRTTVEYGTPIELVCELQEIFYIYANGVINPDGELLLLQDCRRNEDYSSIVILLQSDIKYDELSKHLKSVLNDEHHDEVNLLIEAIKQAKADNHETLCVYNC